MGHMDNVPDDNAKRWTITIFYDQAQGNQTFTGCSNLDSNDRQLLFTDQHGKTHEFFGVVYHIAEE